MVCDDAYSIANTANVESLPFGGVNIDGSTREHDRGQQRRANVLAGGGGADALTGGAGNDVFRYTAKADSTLPAMDTIGDF